MSSARLVSIALCLGVAIATCGGSCAHSKVDTVPPDITVSRQTLDEEVIEAVLVDLATGSDDDDSETLRREQGKGRVIFSSESRQWMGTLRQELTSAESEKWKSLASPDRNAAKEAAASIIDRVENKQHFAAFHPKDSHILLWEDDPASTRPAEPFRRRNTARPITAAPPGYGDQRRLAVVVLSFAWSMHSGDATYVLRFDGKNWNVISRHFAYYV